MKMNLVNVDQDKNFDSVLLSKRKAWVFKQIDQKINTKKVFGTIEFKGNLNIKALEKSLREIYTKLDYIEQSNELVVNKNDLFHYFSFEYVDFDEEKKVPSSLIKTLTNESSYSFSSIFLFKCTVLKTEKRKFLLTLYIHQKINEGLVLLTLLKDIMYQYSLQTKDDEIREEVIAIQYK